MTRSRWALAPVLAIALLASACSGGGDAASDTTLVVTTSSTTDSASVAIPTDESTASTDDVVAAGESELALLAPLTGLPIDAAIVNRPALAAKIDNVSAARPQAGLNQADIVYEERVEGGLTRLLAVFHSQDAPVLGPIRSARSTDVPLLTPLQQPLFAWSGANAAFAALIRSVAIRDVGFEAEPSSYTRASDRRAPSNLMTSTQNLWALITYGSSPPEALLHLDEGDVFTSGDAAAAVSVSYRGTTVTHTWDADLGGWAREQNGSAHVDSDGVVVAPTNVIVQFVDYKASGQVDSVGAEVPEAILEGEGTIWAFSNGRVVEGTWTKDNVTAPMVYLDANGEPLLLTPGSTWVLLPEPGNAELLP